MRGGIFPQNLGRVKTLLVLGITLRLLIRGAGYSNLMLCIYTVPGGRVFIMLWRCCLNL
jgi:hypothetical protein